MASRNRSPLLRPAVRAVLVDPEDRVLMVRWTLEGPDGRFDVWGTPGGGIDPGETHEDAVRRELLEETGLVVAAVTAPTSAADFVERLLTDGRPAQPLELAL